MCFDCQWDSHPSKDRQGTITLIQILSYIWSSMMGKNIKQAVNAPKIIETSDHWMWGPSLAIKPYNEKKTGIWPSAQSSRS